MVREECLQVNDLLIEEETKVRFGGCRFLSTETNGCEEKMEAQQGGMF